MPEAPEGYSWVQVKEIKAAFLVPESWYFTFKSTGDQNMYTISRDRVDDQEPVRTGLTIIVRRKESFEKYGYIRPSEFAGLLLRKAQRKSELERFDEGEQGVFHTKRYQFIRKTESGEVSREFNLILANDSTGTLYIMTCVAPVKEWEVFWNSVQVILQNMILDDEV